MSNVVLEVFRSSLGFQVAIGLEKEFGYRIAGPKFNGSKSDRVLVKRLTQRDAEEIRYFLDCVLQENPSE